MIDEQEELEVKLTQFCKSKQEAKDLLEKVFGSSKYIKETEDGLAVCGLLLYCISDEKRTFELAQGFKNIDAQRNVVSVYNLLDKYGYVKILGKIDMPCIRNSNYYKNLAEKLSLCYQYRLELKDLRPAWFRNDESLKRLTRVLKNKFGKRFK